MARISILLNLHTLAASQFFAHGCAAATVFDKEFLLAKEDGLYVSTGDSDGVIIEGEVSTPIPIQAYVALPTLDCGYKGQKTPRSIILGGAFSGAMRVSITDERGTTVNYDTESLGSRDGIKIALQSSQRSRYFIIKISSIDGADFSLESADFIFIPGPERRM